ncbi:hypothetical protein J4573_37740 [Actinomadura barringtoniae]|uniref:Alpha/beta hydrolase n=1 Tax=Actinomadura barringtoniae TaxID=1427535 RepID=A0A939PI53_9ACTN|nr:hypothetical protein [Actinomadura barringtoniae]MBO2452885.1 hypothetical protein [Actinomadura barringtoniae]
MSGDHQDLPPDQTVPIHGEISRPISGTAAGTAYVALPPTAVDARPAGPTRLIVAWPGFDAPRTAAAMAAAVPMTGVPTWRVYLELPGRPHASLASGALLEDRGLETYCTAVEQAAGRLPDVLAELRRDLGVGEGPVGLAGFSAGGAAALLALALGAVPVSTVALVAPVLAPARAVRNLEKRAGRRRNWSDGAQALADRLDLGSRAAVIAGRGAALLLVGGAKDRLVPPNEITALRDLLRQCGAEAVESASFRMGHSLAAEPGTEPKPPITEAVRVDGVLTDWFRERLAEIVPPRPPRSKPTAQEPAVQEPAVHEPAAQKDKDTDMTEHRPAQGPVPLHLEGSGLQAVSHHP